MFEHTPTTPSIETCQRIIADNDAHRLTAASACQKGVVHYDIHYRQTAEAETILRRNGENLPIIDRAGRRREHFRIALAHFLAIAREADESGDDERRRLTRAWLEHTLAACADTLPPDEYASAANEARTYGADMPRRRETTKPAEPTTVIPFPERKAS